MHFVYILQSLKTHRFYIGASANVAKRLEMHNRGGTRSTRPYRPWIAIYSEQHSSKSTAEKREWYLKHPAGYLEKKALVEQYGKYGGVA